MTEFNALIVICLRNGLIGIAVLSVLYLIGWLMAGRTLTIRDAIQTNKPPDSLSPAAVRYIHTLGRAELFTGLTADLVNIAIKRYICIEEENGLYRITRNKEYRSSLTSDEIGVIDGLLGDNESLTFTPHIHRKEVMNPLRSLNIQFQNVYGRKYFPKSSLMSIMSWVIAAILTVLTLYPLSSLGFDVNIFVIAWMSFAIASILFWALVIYAYTEVRDRKRAGGLSLDTDRIRVLIPVVFAVMFTGGTTLFYFLEFQGVNIPLIIFPILTLWVSRTIIGSKIRIVSPSGNDVLRQIEGFKAYLTGKGATASKEMMDIQHFEEYLPYAIALGVAVEWGARFKCDNYTPSWYVETKRKISTPVGLASVISTNLTNAIYIAAAPSGAPVNSPS